MAPKEQRPPPINLATGMAKADGKMLRAISGFLEAGIFQASIITTSGNTPPLPANGPG